MRSSKTRYDSIFGGCGVACDGFSVRSFDLAVEVVLLEEEGAVLL